MAERGRRVSGLDPDYNVGDVSGVAAASRRATEASALRLPSDTPTPVAVPEPAPEPVPDPAPRTTGRRRAKEGERWDDLHVRRTFHLPVALVDELEAAVAADEDLSRSGVVTDALQAWLDRRRRTARRTTTPTTTEET